MGFHTPSDGTSVWIEVFNTPCLTRLPGGPSNSGYLPHSNSATQAHDDSPESPSEQAAPDTPEAPGAHAPAVVLSGEQRSVLEMVQRRESVFFTGSAGNKLKLLLLD